MADIHNGGATEMDTFLPTDQSILKDGALTGKYKVQVAARDAEVGRGEKSFDPFKERQVENPTTDCDTLTHLLKASLGTGILAMPLAFKNAGLVVGVIATVAVAILCTHCAYVLVKCAHTLYYRTRRSEMSFADVAETACANGPQWGRKFAQPMKYLVQISLFVTYFGTCSVYSVIVSENFRQVIEHYSNTELEIRGMIAALLVPMILLSWVPNLKYLAPVSMVANVFMATGLGITFYYLVLDPKPLSEVPLAASISDFPQFLSISIFAMEAIGVVMPLENSMKTPQHFVGICGVLNKGMGGVTLIYILLGFMGYIKYLDKTGESITYNLPIEEIPAQAVKILIGLAVFCTFGLQFFVCLEIAWNGIKDRFTKKPLLANYILRTVLVAGAVALAVAVPKIGPLVGLIGAFCFSILGLMIPVFIETITYWDTGFGPGNWVAVKNIIIAVVSVMALIFGSSSAVQDIVKEFSGAKNETESASSITESVSNITESAINTILSAMNTTTNSSIS